MIAVLFARTDSRYKDFGVYDVYDINRDARGFNEEYPKGSRFFKEAGCPDVGAGYDEYGGFTILVDQFDFGHVAHKNTKLYICGIKIEDLPELPPKNLNSTDRSICGNVKGTKRCTQYQREYTPDGLIDFLTKICERITK